MIATSDGPEALAAMAVLDTIDVLLTDVILPKGMLGPEIARELPNYHPHAKVLLMSGHTRGANTSAIDIDETYELLQKPFTRVELSDRLRQLIDPSEKTPAVAAQ